MALAEVGAPGAERAWIFATKTSEPPALVRVVDPKVAVPWKFPVTIAEPSERVLMPWLLSYELPPACVAHT